MNRPLLTQASRPLTFEIAAVNEHGEIVPTAIAGEHPLTLYVDKQEIVTLMTSAPPPKRSPSATCATSACSAVWPKSPPSRSTGRSMRFPSPPRTAAASRPAVSINAVTTGCGQGTVFGEVQAALGDIHLPAPDQARLRQSTLAAQLEQMRRQDSVHRKAGSVHGCALFRGTELLFFSRIRRKVDSSRSNTNPSPP